MSDSMVDNRNFRTLNVVDDGLREVLAIEVNTSLSSKRFIRTLYRILNKEESEQPLEQIMAQSLPLES
jgi:putative transposase